MAPKKDLRALVAERGVLTMTEAASAVAGEPIRGSWWSHRAGSAIFLHLAKEENGSFGVTEGCVALRLADMLTLLARVTDETHMTIGLSSAA